MQRHSVTSLETAPPLANGPSGEGLWGNSLGIAAFPISLLSMAALEESVGGAERRGKFSSMEGKHAPSILYYDSVPTAQKNRSARPVIQ